MAAELVTMSTREIDRLDVVRRVLEHRLTQAKAGELIGLSERQVRRLCDAYEHDGPSGLASKKRGRPSNHRLAESLQAHAVALVRERYADFGPRLAHEKLVELHDVRVGRETIRKWLIEAGIWLPRSLRVQKAHQPRHRRDCLGELVQIDGCDHEWFEDRGPRCTLLVYVDDATGRAMELRFVQSESAFDYFASTTTYLKRYGKPVAFYSDKHSIFRVYREGSTGPSKGVTQFGRALAELNIDIICANSPQAKPRVERMHQTFQDRLVKELRLGDIATIDAGNAFLPEFMDDYNRRFARAPKNVHDAHRPLHGDEDLQRIFTWQEERTLSQNLTVHYKRATYLIEPSPETLPLARKRVRIHEWEDGRVEIHCQGRQLPYSVFDKNRCVSQGAIVENKRLGAVLSLIQVKQAERDRVRLASKKLTLREKERVRAAREAASAPPLEQEPASGGDRLCAVFEYLEEFKAEQKEKQRRYNRKAAFRRQAAGLLASLREQAGGTKREPTTFAPHQSVPLPAP